FCSIGMIEEQDFRHWQGARAGGAVEQADVEFAAVDEGFGVPVSAVPKLALGDNGLGGIAAGHDAGLVDADGGVLGGGFDDEPLTAVVRGGGPPHPALRADLSPEGRGVARVGQCPIFTSPWGERSVRRTGWGGLGPFLCVVEAGGDWQAGGAEGAARRRSASARLRSSAKTMVKHSLPSMLKHSLISAACRKVSARSAASWGA